MIPLLAAFTAILSFAGAMIWAGIGDLTTMRIRNELVLALIALYAALAPLAGFGVAEIGLSAAVALAIFLCTFIFFALGWIGGGDAKLAAVIALWLGADQVLAFVVYAGLFGGALTLALLQFRMLPLPAQFLGVPWIARLHAPETGIPYGVALTSAALVLLPETGWAAALS
jgi:prepilin peptidase CpaA